MKTDGLPPISELICFGDDGKNAGDVGPCCNAKKKEEKVERNITLRKLKSEEDEAHAQKTNGHGSLVTPGQGQTAGGQQGEAIPDRKRDEETPDLPMRKEEAVFDEGKDG